MVLLVLVVGLVSDVVIVSIIDIARIGVCSSYVSVVAVVSSP